MSRPYAKKSVAELDYIIKDAGEAARAMRGHDAKAEAKYLDQVNEAVSELYRRRNARKCATCGQTLQGV